MECIHKLHCERSRKRKAVLTCERSCSEGLFRDAIAFAKRECAWQIGNGTCVVDLSELWFLLLCSELYADLYTSSPPFNSKKNNNCCRSCDFILVIRLFIFSSCPWNSISIRILARDCNAAINFRSLDRNGRISANK